MKFIAHRGNINGVEIEKENTLEYIVSAIEGGFDVEIDMWYKDNSFYLGHDNFEYKISLAFLQQFSVFLWCHAKDIYTLNELLKYFEINCFFHQNDNCTLTSHKYIWTYPEKSLTERSILLKFAKDENFTIPKNIFGICSDNVEYYKNKLI
jgi:hypothetical protein